MHLDASHPISPQELVALRNALAHTFPWKRPDRPRLVFPDKHDGGGGERLGLVEWDLTGGKARPADSGLVPDLLEICGAPHGKKQGSLTLRFIRRHGPLRGASWMRSGDRVEDYVESSRIVRAFVQLCRTQESESPTLRGILAEAIGVREFDSPNENGACWVPNGRGRMDLQLMFALIPYRAQPLPTQVLLKSLLGQWARDGRMVPVLDLAEGLPQLRWPGNAWSALTASLQTYFLRENWILFCDFCGRPYRSKAAPKASSRTHSCGKKACHNRRARDTNKASRERLRKVHGRAT